MEEAKETWTGGFVSHDGSAWVVRVSSAAASASSHVAALAADDPLVLELDDDEDLYVPVREGRATVRMVGLPGELPVATEKMQRRVDIERDGVAVWRGWLTAESLSQEWRAAPSAIDLNATGSAGALQDVEWDLGASGTTTLWDVLWTAAERGGGLIDAMVLPRVYFILGHGRAADPREYLSRLSLQNAAFDDGGGDPSSWGAAVEAVMRLLGWTLCDTGTEWRVVDVDNWRGEYVRYTSREDTGTAVAVGGGDIGAGALRAAGSGHKVDWLQPYGTFTVTAGGGSGADDTLEVDWQAVDRRGDYYQRIINDDLGGQWNGVPVGTTRTMEWYFYCGDSPEGAKGLRMATRRTRYVMSSDGSTESEVLEPGSYDGVFFPGGSDRKAWGELTGLTQYSTHGNLPSPTATCGGVPLLLAQATWTAGENGDEWDTYQRDYIPTVRLVAGYYERLVDGTSPRFRQVPAGSLGAVVSWTAAAMSIPHGPSGTQDYVLDIRMTLKAMKTDYSLIGRRPSDAPRKPLHAGVTFAVRIGDRWYDGTRLPGQQWRAWDGVEAHLPLAGFECDISGEDDAMEYELTPHTGARTFGDGRDDVEGYAIPLEGSPDFGEIEVRMMMPGVAGADDMTNAIVAVDVTGVSLAFVQLRLSSPDDICIDGEWQSDYESGQAEAAGGTGTASDGTEKEWRRKVGTGGERDAVDLTLSSYDAAHGATGAGVVLDGQTGLERFAHVTLGQDGCEEMLLERLSRHYASSRKLWTLEAEDCDVDAAGAWSMGPVPCACTGWQRRPLDGTQTVCMQQL